MVKFACIALLGCALAAIAAPGADIKGAAYFMTDDVHGNFIIANTIHSDGTIEYASKTYTGGQGAREYTFTLLVDPLNGQGALAIDGKHLYVVNAGSHTVSMFSIDLSNPTKLTMVGEPVKNSYEFPHAITISPKTGAVCVSYTGKFNGVECFRPTNQGLKAIANTQRGYGFTNQTTPATFRYSNGAASIIFNADGNKLYGITHGNHGPLGPYIQPMSHGYIQAWDVASDDTLSTSSTKSTVVSPGLMPFAGANIPGADAVIIADATFGVEIFDFSKGDSAKITYFKIPTNLMVCWISYSKTLGTFFLTDPDGEQIIELAVDSETLNVTYINTYPLAKHTQPIDNAIATIDGTDYLYQLAPNATQVSILKLVKGGKSTFIQTVDYTETFQKADIPYSVFNLQGMAIYLK